MKTKPEAPPEGRLLEDAREAHVPKLSQAKAGERAGISGGRWRQAVCGYQIPSKGEYVIVRPPADTLARMARAVGVSAAQMRAVGRDDVASLLNETSEADARARNPPKASTLALARERLEAAQADIAEAMNVLVDLEGQR